DHRRRMPVRHPQGRRITGDGRRWRRAFRGGRFSLNRPATLWKGRKMTRTEADQLVFCPLGGVGEIGMNFALYGFGPARARKWLVVDVGVSFPDAHLPGVDLVLPDTRFVESV